MRQVFSNIRQHPPFTWVVYGLYAAIIAINAYGIVDQPWEWVTWMQITAIIFVLACMFFVYHASEKSRQLDQELEEQARAVIDSLRLFEQNADNVVVEEIKLIDEHRQDPTQN